MKHKSVDEVLKYSILQIEHKGKQNSYPEARAVLALKDMFSIYAGPTRIQDHEPPGYLYRFGREPQLNKGLARYHIPQHSHNCTLYPQLQPLYPFGLPQHFLNFLISRPHTGHFSCKTSSTIPGISSYLLAFFAFSNISPSLLIFLPYGHQPLGHGYI